MEEVEIKNDPVEVKTKQVNNLYRAFAVVAATYLEQYEEVADVIWALEMLKTRILAQQIEEAEHLG